MNYRLYMSLIDLAADNVEFVIITVLPGSTGSDALVEDGGCDGMDLETCMIAWSP